MPTDDALLEPETVDEPRKPTKSLRERIDTRLKELGLWPEPQRDKPSGFKVYKDSAGQDCWIAWYSNNFEDRDGEFFSEKGIDAFVSRVDMGVVPLPELWSWHTPGTRYGVADWVDRIGHFAIATGAYDDTAAGRAGKAYDAKHADEYGVSHGFLYAKSGLRDVDGKRVYDADWNTFEISPLPFHKAANLITGFAVEQAAGLEEKGMTPEKRDHLVKKFGEDYVKQLEADTERMGKAQESLKGYKDFVAANTAATPNEKAVEAAEQTFGELVGALTDGAAQALEASAAAVKAASDNGGAVSGIEARVKSVEAELAAMRAEMNLKPKSVQQGGGAVLDAEKGAEVYAEVKTQFTKTNSFWGTEETDAAPTKP